MVSNSGNSRNAGDETTVEVSKNVDHTSRGSKLEQSLEDKLPRIEDLLNVTQNHRRQHDMSDEIDFYQVKNTLLCSYLLDLANLIQVAVVRQCGGGIDDGQEEDGNHDLLVDKSVKETIGRLDHMRIVMDKLRSLDQKLAYGMEKQLSLAHQIESKVAAAGGDISDMDAILSLMNEDNDEQQQQPRPNPSSMGMKASKKTDAEAKKKKKGGIRKKKQVSEDDESEDDSSSSSSDSDDDEDIDEDLKMAKSIARMGKPTSVIQQTSNTKRKRKNKDEEDHSSETSEDDDESESSSDDDNDDDDNDGVYRVPKMSSVEYYEQSAKKEEQERRFQKKQQEKLRRSEVMQTLMEQYGHAPEVQEHAAASGTATTTTTTMMDASTSRMLKKLKEKEDFEETYMIRLNETRQEKKERNKVRSFQSHGSLSAISDLGNLAAGISSSSGTHQSGPSRSKNKRRGGEKRRRR